MITPAFLTLCISSCQSWWIASSLDGSQNPGNCAYSANAFPSLDQHFCYSPHTHVHKTSSQTLQIFFRDWVEQINNNVPINFFFLKNTQSREFMEKENFLTIWEYMDCTFMFAKEHMENMMRINNRSPVLTPAQQWSFYVTPINFLHQNGSKGVQSAPEAK